MYVKDIDLQAGKNISLSLFEVRCKRISFLIYMGIEVHKTDYEGKISIEVQQIFVFYNRDMTFRL